MISVLVVDDNENNKQYLKNLLEGTGYKVYTANNGNEGIEIATNNALDIIISDIMMPGMNGYRFCREIKNSELLKNIPFVFYTATFVEKEDEILGMNLGASRFIIKPMDSDAFISIINGVLDEYKNGKLTSINSTISENEDLFKLYDGSVSRKLEETVIKLRNERNALKESERELKEAQDIGKIGHWKINQALKTDVWSDQMFRIQGLKPNCCVPSFERFVQSVHPEDRERFKAVLSDHFEKKTSKTMDFRLLLENNKTVYINSRFQTEFDEGGNPEYTMCIFQDITERKEIENNLKETLEKNKNLIRELYHRTHNNMQVISSMLSMKARFVDDERVRNIFNDIVRRIKTMSLVHNNLYQTKNLSKIDLKSYLTDLINYIKSDMKNNCGKITFNLDIQSVSVVIDIALPFGLIVNELITNSVKYAFPEERSGEISIVLSENTSEMIEFRYADNGIGHSSQLENSFSDGHGLFYIQLLSKQINAKIEYMSENGVYCDLYFPVKYYSERSL